MGAESRNSSDCSLPQGADMAAVHMVQGNIYCQLAPGSYVQRHCFKSGFACCEQEEAGELLALRREDRPSVTTPEESRSRTDNQRPEVPEGAIQVCYGGKRATRSPCALSGLELAPFASAAI